MWGVVSMRICLGFNYGSLNLPVDETGTLAEKGGLGCSILFLVLFTGPLFLLVDGECINPGLTPEFKFEFAVARRVVLFIVAMSAVVLAQSAMISASLGFLFVVDLILSPWTFRHLGIIEPDPRSSRAVSQTTGCLRRSLEFASQR